MSAASPAAPAAFIIGTPVPLNVVKYKKRKRKSKYDTLWEALRSLPDGQAQPLPVPTGVTDLAFERRIRAAVDNKYGKSTWSIKWDDSDRLTLSRRVK